MFNNVALDVFIGLVFVFLLYSLLATILQEMIAVRFAFRSKVLEKAILRMLEDGKTTTRIPYGDRVKGVMHMFGLVDQLKGKGVAVWFYAHPLIKYLAEDNYYSKPAYIDANNFSKVLIDLLKGFGQPESSIVQTINNSIASASIYKLPINISDSAADKANPAIKILRDQNINSNNSSLPTPADLTLQKVSINTNTALFLKSLWQESGADVEKFRQKLEEWFDDTMERATGWYKRYTQLVLFAIGLVIAVVFNVDTIAIHRILLKDKPAREELVQMAINNREKLGEIVNNQKTADTLFRNNDSLLQNTYNFVLEDANETTQVLGLDRSWRDTCKMCDTSYYSNEKAYLGRLDTLKIKEIEFNNWKQTSRKLKIEIDSLTKKSLKAKVRKSNLKAIQQLNTKIKFDDSSLRVNDSLISGTNIKKLEDSIKQMTVFAWRCPYIKKQTEGKWFKYSPNQSGGWETLFGWIITALAISLGAPFWFDLLNRLIKLRGTGTKITSADKDTGSTNISASTSSTSSGAPTAPVNVNVNSNTGEEAVG